MKIPKFDTHTHTTYSDGVLHPIELANIIPEDVSFIMTDHHSLAAHDVGGIGLCAGVEICCYTNTSAGPVTIEVLAYGDDVDLMQKRLLMPGDKQELFFRHLKTRLSELGCVFDPNVSMKDGLFAHAIMWNQLHTNAINHTILGSMLTGPDTFYRQSQVRSNPLYLDPCLVFPHVRDVCSSTHKANCVTMLAHPHAYVCDLKECLESVKNFVGGIECLHPTADHGQSKHLLEYCKSNYLCASGGTDYHSGDYLGTPNFDLVANYQPEFEWIARLIEYGELPSWKI